MNKLKKMVLGAAGLGVLLAVTAPFFPAQATAVRTLVLTTITATTGTITTLTSTSGTVTTLGSTTASISSATVSTAFRGPAPAAQTLAAGGTIAADACGGVKAISSASNVTTDTTNTIAAPSTVGYCKMLVINTGSFQIALDANTLFPLAGSAASLKLDSGGSVWVWSNGSAWYHGAFTEY
jgi:hypothetical protein